MNSGNLGNLVERQMRNWELARSQRTLAEKGSKTPDVADFVCISRSVGAGGLEIARRLGDRLQWPVFDKEIMDHMAADDQLRHRLYERMDEHDMTWLESMLSWALHGEFYHEDYFHRLTEAVFAIARQSPAIFVGRGADLILPADRGLRIRITAPIELCVKNFSKSRNITAAEARRLIDAIERDRRDYIQRHFARDVLEPNRYDLTLNTRRFSPDEAVEVILSALRAKSINQS